MGLAEKRNADSKMAHRLKDQGIQRTHNQGHQRCPVCNSMVSNAGFYNHIRTHK